MKDYHLLQKKNSIEGEKHLCFLQMVECVALSLAGE